MLKNKLQKGDKGYLDYKKKIVLFETIIMFAVSLLIFIIGYLYKGTKANILSVVAVLGLLPASKSLVSLIMYLKTPKYDEEVYSKLEDTIKNNKGMVDLYFTTYQKNFPVNALICKKDCIIGYTEFKKCDVKALEEHLLDTLKQTGHKEVTIKIFTDINKFEDRAKQLETFENSQSLTKLIQDIIL